MVYTMFALLSFLVAIVTAAAPYCLPQDSCFPSASELTAFNASVSGRLLAPPPYGQVCYAGFFDLAACANLVKNKMNEPFRKTIPAAVQYTNYEFDQDGDGCPVPDTVPSTPLTGECVLGGLATYIVNVTSVQQISEAVLFAAKYNLRLRVKNTGHDYTGRSTGEGAFTIWTHNLDTIEHLPDFQPSQCYSTSDVIAIGAGVVNEDLYAAGGKFNRTTVGGFYTGVGAGGGFIVGGGAAGPLQPLYGMGIDNVVQYDVVKADGCITTANACQNEDLFFAMRGGGGAFAIATRTYYMAHPAFAAVNTVAGTVTANSTEVYEKMIQELIKHYPGYIQNFTSGIVETSYPTLALSFQIGFQAASAVVQASESLAVFGFLTSLPGTNNTVTADQFPTFNEAYTEVIGPVTGAGGVVGVDLIETSRIVSEALFSTEAGRTSVSDFIISLPAGQATILQLIGGGAVNKVSVNATPVNPAFRSSVGYVDLPVFSTSNGPVTAQQNTTIEALMAQADTVFGTNAYYNEDNKMEPDFTTAYWGSNYPRLLRIKKTVDPNGVLSAPLYVGSEIYGS